MNLGFASKLAAVVLGSTFSAMALAQAPQGQPAHASDRVFQPGTRLTYFVGDTQVPGESTSWTPDPNGNWVNKNGDRFRKDENWPMGGYGYYQHTVVAMDATNYGFETREYIVGDVAKRIFTLTTTRGFMARRGDEIAGLWVHPRELAELKNDPMTDQRVYKMQYTIGNQQFNAVRLQYRRDDGNYSQRTYDLDTGLLLAESSMTTGQGPLVTGDDDNLKRGRGTTTLRIVRFEGARRLNLPFRDSNLPEWTRNLQQMAFAGTLEVMWKNSDIRVPGEPVQSVFDVRRQGGMLTGNWTSWRGQQQDILNTVEVKVVNGPFAYGQLWLGPANLQQGQVLDEDPYTGVRAFVETMGQQIVIAESSPWQYRRWAYDANTRMLIWTQSYLDQGVGGQLINMQLKSTR